MNQLALWTSEAAPAPERVVNVSQIPQRSPLRYPGGKTWLVPHVRTWLRSGKKPKLFIEPFVGGGIVSLTVAFENLADRVVMVELDDEVAALWETIFGDDNEWLADRVVSFDLSLESAKELITASLTDPREIGFRTLLKNRTYHGGILAPGSGLLKYGENGKGIKSRWYAQTLAKRIRNIAHVRDKITFIKGDGIEVIKKYASRKTAAFLIDPPYTAGRKGKRAGNRLYTHFELNHDELFRQAEQIEGKLLMTYDNDEEVKALAARHGFETGLISMMNTHHATMQELIIGHDLAWAAEL